MAQVNDTSAGVVKSNNTSLYVGDLKPEVTEQILWSAFAVYGQITGVRICRDSSTSSSLGYGYVNFRLASDAEKAMVGLNLTPIEGKPCRIMWCMRDPSRRKNGAGNLYIKNIDPSLSSRDLYDAFTAFGPILSCKLAVDETGRTRGFGFIQFYNEKDADMAIAKANGVQFMNKVITITKFLTRSQRNQQSGEKASRFTNVFVKNFKDEWTVDDLKKNFASFGEITSCIVKFDADGKSLGFGFVNFATPESALEAVTKMKGFKTPKGLELFVDRAQKKSERDALLRSLQEKRRLDSHRRYHKMNLYVKNFESFTDETLKTEFAAYGPIQSARVMKDESGKSKGFGFVCFTKPEDAEKALQGLQSKMFDNKPLYISYAQNREERKTMIQQRICVAPFNRGGSPMASYAYMFPSTGPQYMPPMRYPPGFNNMAPRQNSRMPQLASMPMNPQFQNIREGYPPHMHPAMYQPPQGYRQRMAGPMPSRPYGNSGPRQYHNQPQGAYRPRAQQMENPAAVANNHITTEPTHSSAPKAKKEEVKSESKPTEKLVIDSKLGDFVHEVATKLFESNKLDSRMIDKLTGVVCSKLISCASDNGLPAEDEVKKTLNEAYKAYIAKISTNPVPSK